MLFHNYIHDDREVATGYSFFNMDISRNWTMKDNKRERKKRKTERERKEKERTEKYRDKL